MNSSHGPVHLCGLLIVFRVHVGYGTGGESLEVQHRSNIMRSRNTLVGLVNRPRAGRPEKRGSISGFRVGA